MSQRGELLGANDGELSDAVGERDLEGAVRARLHGAASELERNGAVEILEVLGERCGEGVAERIELGAFDIGFSRECAEQLPRGAATIVSARRVVDARPELIEDRLAKLLRARIERPHDVLMQRPAELHLPFTRMDERYTSSMTTSARERPRLALAGGGAGDGGGDGPFVMTPALRQAIALLQMSRLELIAEIRRELDAQTPQLDVT